MTANREGQRHDRTAIILYGSETGNSQDAAEQLGRISERLHFATRVVEMDDVEINELLNYSIVIFAISTTGQGDIPNSARKFWKSLLRKRLPPDCLGHVMFTTFGMGDSSYVKFNWAARKLHKRLEQLGAQEFYPRGEADEQHEEGTDGAFLPWSIHFKEHLLERFPLPEGQSPVPDNELLPPKWTLELARSDETIKTSQTEKSSTSTSHTDNPDTMDGPIRDLCVKDGLSSNEEDISDNSRPPDDLLPIPFSVTVLVEHNIRMTPQSHWQDVRHINLLAAEHVAYEPGDIITIYPKNFPSDVNSLIELMDWTSVADLPLVFENTGPCYLTDTFIPSLSKYHTTSPPTLRSLLLHNLDITAIPRRYFFDLISKFTPDPVHRSRLQDFTNPAFTDEFFDYATRPRRSILEVLQDFPTVKLPWRWATTIFPLLRGRQFSLASGGAIKNPSDRTTRFQIAVAIVKYRTVLRKVRQGVCSRYISTLAAGTKINVTLCRGSFSIQNPNMLSRPILMIAPGTGVAPMRSLILERAHRLPIPTFDDPNPPVVLIFGGRNRLADFLYEREWMRKDLDVKVLTAFSRDQKEKLYVQDVIRQNAAMVWKMLGPGGAGPTDSKGGGNGTVCVCGSSGKMPIAVRSALTDVFIEMGDMTLEAAEAYLAAMEKQGRFVQETW